MNYIWQEVVPCVDVYLSYMGAMKRSWLHFKEVHALSLHALCISIHKFNPLKCVVIPVFLLMDCELSLSFIVTLRKTQKKLSVVKV